jgi:predicted nuclease of predicted toxin-antitoxin system
MKVLLDSCISSILRPTLQASKHDVLWVGDWPQDPGDAEILTFAYREQRIVITLDKDFGALAIRDKQPHTGIIRLVNLSLRDQPSVCAQILGKHGEILLSGAIITVDQKRIRIRLPES